MSNPNAAETLREMLARARTNQIIYPTYARDVAALDTALQALALVETLRRLVMAWDSDEQLEEVLDAIALWLDLDRDSESDPEVKACLESAAEHCRHAALDYYASTK